MIIDLGIERDRFKAAEKVFDICLHKEVKRYVCAHEIITLSYLLQKYFKREKVKFFLEEILDMFTVIPGTNEILSSALNSNIKDYEDAVIEVSAKQEGIDYIITRNLKDFAAGNIEALSPEEFILLIEEN